ncbi:MAG: flagellar biosynthesis protein FlhA [Candidatus Zixiibacteriota bacterium]|nr:MAG: flagellar biosynthesis protein FlhA [candidate division Zixibacteria bacterium]
MAATTATSSFSHRFASRSDVVLAVGVIGILILMVVPIPTFALDLLLALNITVAVVILMVAMYTEEPLSFSVFPGLLLVVTLFRLSLNVASTRLILGEAYAGSIIQAFGTFVVGGNYVVGVVIFLILNVINFAVITKGSGRIAEVAARFTLDAMPGKQMAIDADLNNGLIDEQEARTRRDKISREADFYGAMDGASKFVRGDAIAGLIITFINILGGLVIGILQLQMRPGEALSTYTIMTVGDGLVAQIPALIISTSAGIIVSRAASEANLGSEITRQLLQQPRPLFLASGVLGFFALVPGLPTAPFLLLAGLSAWLGTQVKASAAARAQAEMVTQKSKTQKEPERIEDYLNVDPMELEIGYGLIPLVDNEHDGDLLSRITLIRKQQAIALGIIIPPIRIRDNIQLKPQQYRLKIRGNEVASGELHMGHCLALDPGTAKGKLKGVATREPTYGLPAVWIPTDDKLRAQDLGYTVVEPAAVLATHLVEVIKQNAHKILSREDTKTLVDNFKKQNSVVVEELIPNLMTYGGVHKVLQKLLKEGIPVRDLGTILETLADYSGLTKEPDILTEYVRYSLSPAITHKYQDTDGKIYALTADPALEKMIQEEMNRAGGSRSGALALPPPVLNRMYQQLDRHVQTMQAQGRLPILVCSPTVRATLRRLVEPVLPQLAVISYGELLVNAEIESVGMLTVEARAEAA